LIRHFAGGKKFEEFCTSQRSGGLHTIRRAQAGDIEAMARLFRAVRRACLPYLPNLHTAEKDLAFFRCHVFAECEVWVAGAIDGFIAFRAGWVDHLYVRPECHRRGLGKALLEIAMDANASLRLWVFQRNIAAIAFYDACGFHEIERADGSRNEEREPDVLMAWTRA
jgi:ribosomal protein S18 acetylase RimI-like enzyme